MSTPSRVLILGALVALSALAARPPDGPASGGVRWPTTDDVFAAPGWTVGPAAAQSANDVIFVSRRYSSASADASAVLSVQLSAQAKKVYRAGPEIPFVGTGYALSPASAELVPADTRWSTVIARRGRDELLLITSQGERRGLLGNGVLGWAAATIDGVTGSSNDYFQATLVVPLGGGDDPAVARAAFALADQVFTQIAVWAAQ